jgi:hypothetical protein
MPLVIVGLLLVIFLLLQPQDNLLAVVDLFEEIILVAVYYDLAIDQVLVGLPFEKAGQAHNVDRLQS